MKHFTTKLKKKLTSEVPQKRPALIRRYYAVLATVSRRYPPSKGTFLYITHPCATLLIPKNFLVRLACVRHAASVRSEPGSNSNVESLHQYVLLTYLLF